MVLGTVSAGFALTAAGSGDVIRHEPVEVEVLGAVEVAPLPAAVQTLPPSTTSTTTTPSTTTTSTTTTSTTTTTTTTTPPPPPPAPAPVAAPTPTVAIGDQALALLTFDWRSRLPGWTLSFEGGRQGVRGMTKPDQKRIEIYVRADDTAGFVARVIAHEVGHALDLELNTGEDRARWRQARGVADEVLWWPDGTSFDFDTLAGDFAEAFAVWQTGASSRSRVGGGFTPDQLAVLVQLVS